MSLTIDGYKLQLRSAWKHRHRMHKARQYVRYCIIRIRDKQKQEREARERLYSNDY